MRKAKGYVDAGYLDVAGKLMPASKERSYELLRLAPGHKVLDIGCGPATDTLALARIVGESGEVHGADHDAAMVEEANARAAAAGLAARVMHRQADATALPWADGSFDASRSERMFQHLLEPEQAFAEMVRVTRSGGRIVVLDGEWSTFTVDCEETDVERRLVQFHAEAMMNNPYSGRSLRRLFRGQGLADITVEVWPVVMTDYVTTRRMMRFDQVEREALEAGVVDAEDLRRWRASLERAAKADAFFASTNGITVAASKP